MSFGQMINSFVLNETPNKQTNTYWDPAHQHNVIEYKKVNGKKVMDCVGMVDGIKPPRCVVRDFRRLWYLLSEGAEE